ncbi:hypothetical protein BD779DRAFT_1494215 [Infundibulicybe gibba]|nr:hypothetical protein BD779DRAFT_1494215 [Infundibulicybe gibba]
MLKVKLKQSYCALNECVWLHLELYSTTYRLRVAWRDGRMQRMVISRATMRFWSRPNGVCMWPGEKHNENCSCGNVAPRCGHRVIR